MRIVITGPESCGKTTLAAKLATHYEANWIPEYARGYVEKLDRPYTYSDVELIGKRQLEEYQLVKDDSLVFYDTALVITKVWFDFVYKIVPDWLEAAIQTMKYDLYLLCYPDIEWEPDPVRENKYSRELLFTTYKEILEKNGFKYEIVRGQGELRTQLAISHVDNHLKINSDEKCTTEPTAGECHRRISP